jgi:uncharacterized protein YjiS (DUF1127 family)
MLYYNTTLGRITPPVFPSIIRTTRSTVAESEPDRPCGRHIAAAQQETCCGAARNLTFHPIESGFARIRKEIIMLVAIINFLRAWKRYNAGLNELYRLGDRELADIGITRGDIPRVAWENAHRIA